MITTTGEQRGLYTSRVSSVVHLQSGEIKSPWDFVVSFGRLSNGGGSFDALLWEVLPVTTHRLPHS